MSKPNKKTKKKSQNKIKFGIKYIAVLAIILLFTILFLPTAIFLTVAMLPTLIAVITDRSSGRNKSFVIGALNFAGCFPYLLKIWVNHNVADMSFEYLSKPETIVVIYGAAAFGYFIYWFITAVVATTLIQRSKVRLKKIEEEKLALEKRWGSEVNGNIPLDDMGFPMPVNSKD